GLGSSELISAKIRKDLPELEILDVTSNLNLEKALARHPDVDILISTINLPKQKHIPQVLVSAMFTVKDKVKVEEALRGEKMIKSVALQFVPVIISPPVASLTKLTALDAISHTLANASGKS
ncbi:BglG family transcription antiterminator, partial [Lacticaseibacillus rhamnosus MTCC 5462]